MDLLKTKFNQLIDKFDENVSLKTYFVKKLATVNVDLLPSSSKAPPGQAAAPAVLRARPGGQQDRGDRAVQVPSQKGLRDRGPNSNNKLRRQQPGQGSLVPLRPQGLSSSPRSRDKAWGRAKPNPGRWGQWVDPWGRPGRQVQPERHHPPW